MNPKRLFFTLFLLYWAGVYGVTFFAGENFKIRLRETIPTGYRMFAPVTNTNYEVFYEFFLNEKLVDTLQLSEYINKEYEKSFYLNKSAYVKDELFQGSLKILDYRYQKALYEEIYEKKPNGFEKQTTSDAELSKIIESLKNFSKVYLSENPEIKSDSVVISVLRSPMILPFAPGYEGDFTYIVGKKIFYTTTQKLNP